VICLDAVVVILRKDRMGVSRYWYRLAFLHKNYKEEMNGFILEGRRKKVKANMANFEGVLGQDQAKIFDRARERTESLKLKLTSICLSHSSVIKF
jgi:hypothetical protein